MSDNTTQNASISQRIMQTFTVQGLETPIRLTKWLQGHFKIPYAYAKQLIRKGSLRINGKRVRTECNVSNDDAIAVYATISIPDLTAKRPISEHLVVSTTELLNQNILFKDERILAINKPRGLATQGGSEIKISVDDVLDRFKFEMGIRPRLVHRLDKDTSGVLLLARTKHVATALAECFKSNSLSKKYLALVAGKVFPTSGTIEGAVAKCGSDDEAKDAITKYKVVSHKDGLTLVEFMPVTGRTHQIRIHAAKFLNAPILGDTKYGGKAAAHKHLCLHAYEIKIDNLFGKPYKITAPLPEYMLAFTDKYF